jgi:peptide/nickel transport system permease protein
VKELEKKVIKANMSQRGLIWFRFKKNKLAVFGLVVMVILLLVCFTSPLYMSYDRVIKQNITKQFQSPNAEYFLGTDMYGRDMFARMLYGGIYSLASGLIVIVMALILGLLFGSVAGYLGGKVDFFIMRLMDVFMSIPFLLLAMTLVVVFGQSLYSLWLALAIANFPGLARIVRSSIMTIRESEYVDAARCYGASMWKILIKHILPNAIGPVVVTTTLMLASTILSIAGLGFLGIGIASPTPEWGTILSEVRDHIRYYPYLGVIPGLAIGFSVLCINFIGDGFRDALDPRTKK